MSILILSDTIAEPTVSGVVRWWVSSIKVEVASAKTVAIKVSLCSFLGAKLLFRSFVAGTPLRLDPKGFLIINAS